MILSPEPSILQAERAQRKPNQSNKHDGLCRSETGRNCYCMCVRCWVFYGTVGRNGEQVGKSICDVT